tara:strand:+ start:43 stop:939 length:897 start_codon:yes stop_codon:yes gene_type:complete
MAVKTKDYFGYKLNISGPRKFKKRVINGKLVEIDPATDAPLTEAARQKYLQQRQSELSEIGKANRQRLRGHLGKLVHSSPTLSTLLKINKQNRELDKAILEKRAPWDLSEIPVSNFDPSTLQAEGLQNKDYLTNAEARRLLKRQELEGNIQQAKHNTYNKNEQLRIRNEKAAENQRISDEYRAKQAQQDPWGVNQFINKDSLLISSNTDGTYVTLANRPQNNQPTENVQTQELPNSEQQGETPKVDKLKISKRDEDRVKAIERTYGAQLMYRKTKKERDAFIQSKLDRAPTQLEVENY